VKGPAGEEVEVQVNPADTVMDLRQFLADMPETCFYSCYDLILTKPDGMRYHLVDFVEIGEVADIAAGCFVEMYNTFYDERAVRLHVRRTRDLCSMAGSYASSSTLMALDYEGVRGLATERDLTLPRGGVGRRRGGEGGGGCGGGGGGKGQEGGKGEGEEGWQGGQGGQGEGAGGAGVKRARGAPKETEEERQRREEGRRSGRRPRKLLPGPGSGRNLLRN